MKRTCRDPNRSRDARSIFWYFMFLWFLLIILDGENSQNSDDNKKIHLCVHYIICTCSMIWISSGSEKITQDDEISRCVRFPPANIYAILCFGPFELMICSLVSGYPQ